MPRRRYKRDRRGRFASTGNSRSGRISKSRTAATGVALALGALYALDGKGPYRIAGSALVTAADLYGASQARRR